MLASHAAEVFINESHCDNAGTDSGEFVEIAGPAGTDLTGWTLVLYNGSSSVLAPYSTVTLDNRILSGDTGTGSGSHGSSGGLGGITRSPFLGLFMPTDYRADY